MNTPQHAPDPLPEPHRTTGWRQLADGQWGFVHAQGAITASGVRNS